MFTLLAHLARSLSLAKFKVDKPSTITVTYNNFENMYENVYKTMVEAGIAKEIEEAIA
jgi:hypothetical protein